MTSAEIHPTMSCIAGIAKLRHCIFPFTKPEASLDWDLDDSHFVLQGHSEDHAAAVIEGQLRLDINADLVRVDAFSATLSVHVVQKRPFREHCPSCRSQRRILQKWDFVVAPETLPRGRHAFPFSASLSGNSPTTMDNELVSITYEFDAVAVVDHGHGEKSQVKLDKCIKVQRAVPEPELPFQLDHSFPPSEFRTEAQLMRIVYPNEPNRVYLRLQGPKGCDPKDPKAKQRWMLRKVSWRLEETIRTMAQACDEHGCRSATGEKEAEYRTATHVVEELDLYNGWKSGSTSADGTVEMEMEYSNDSHNGHSGMGTYSCDMVDWEGIEVAHTLVVEFAVCWEGAPRGNGHAGACITAGHMLRMRYPVIMADHPADAASWEADAPPRYEDVPPEPPCYSGFLGSQ